MGFVLALAIVGVPVMQGGFVPPPAWTCIGSAGIVDDSSIKSGNFRQSNNALEYDPTVPSLATIVARFNVVDIGDSGGTVWNTLELGYIDTSTQGAVTATLFEVDPCTDTPTAIATVTSVDNPSGGDCVSDNFAPTIDFTRHLYYVQTVMSRTSTQVNPRVLSLRIHG
jgi:hypothetical protein